MSEKTINKLLNELDEIEAKNLERKEEDDEILKALRVTFGLEKEEVRYE